MVKYRPVSTSTTSGLSLTLVLGTDSTNIELQVGRYERDGFHVERSYRRSVKGMTASVGANSAGIALDELSEILQAFAEDAFIEAREMRVHE